MIHVNLLGSRPRPATRRFTIDLSGRVTAVCVAIVVVTLAGIGWRFWSLRGQADQVRQDLTVAGEEITRLAPVLEHVTRVEQERDRLAERVAAVTAMRSRRGGPVRALAELSRSLPEGAWLTRLEQQPDAVLVRGQSLSLGALSTFVTNLEASDAFVTPVAIVDSRIEELDQREVVQFELRATLPPVRP